MSTRASERLLAGMGIRRVGRVLMYGGLVLSGLFLSLHPSRLVTASVPAWVATAWAICMIVSAGICFFGAVTDRWIGEFSGIPLLSSVMALYGLSALSVVRTTEPENLTLFGFSLILLSFSAGLLARWRDVQSLLNLSRAPGIFSIVRSRLERRVKE